MRSYRVRAAVGVGVLLTTALTSAAYAEEAAGSPVTVVAKLTGPDSINDTSAKWEVTAGDLGIIWDNGNGQTLMAFGDSYGPGWTGPGAGVGDPATLDWRCNLLARSSDHDLSDGMSFDDMVVDRPGHAKELLPCEKQAGVEATVIPTAGIAVGKRSYLHYMSVNYWGAAGRWFTNYGGIAYSDDNGQTWIDSPDTRWVNTSGSWNNPFQVASYVRSDGYVYMFGTQNGRGGPAYVARVPEKQLLKKAKYEYWTGTAWRTGSEWQAAPIVTNNVGELSVQYNEHLRRWIMLYVDDARGVGGQPAIVLRQAPAPTGPWSGEKVIVSGQDYPGLYGSYIHPWSSGSDLYFAMSQWGPYNVYLMKTTLEPSSDPANLLSEPGFEGQIDGETAPWAPNGNGGIDRGTGNAHSGANNGWVRTSSDGFQDLHQGVVVVPNTDYRLTAWVRTSESNAEGYFGVRLPGGGPVVEEQPFGAFSDYTQLTVEFNSGAHTRVEVFSGMWVHNATDTWIQVDDVALTTA